MSGTAQLCGDVRCAHPKGWHRLGVGSCLECGCPGFSEELRTCEDCCTGNGCDCLASKDAA